MRSAILLSIVATAASVVAQFNISGLGSAYPFGCLSHSGITNTGLTTITGDMGAAINPLLGSSITGFPPGICTGATALSSVAVAALNDATTAFTTVAGLTNATVVTGALDGLILSPGVYKFLSSAQLTTTLTLLGTGSSADAWYFQIGSTLVTAPGSKVVMSGSTSRNVFWQVGSSATLGTTCSMVGTILAAISITVNKGATCDGGLLALAGAITLDTCLISAPPPPAVVSATTSSLLPSTSALKSMTSLLSFISSIAVTPTKTTLSIPIKSTIRSSAGISSTLGSGSTSSRNSSTAKKLATSKSKIVTSTSKSSTSSKFGSSATSKSSSSPSISKIGATLISTSSRIASTCACTAAVSVSSLSVLTLTVTSVLTLIALPGTCTTATA